VYNVWVLCLVDQIAKITKIKFRNEVSIILLKKVEYEIVLRSEIVD